MRKRLAIEEFSGAALCGPSLIEFLSDLLLGSHLSEVRGLRRNWVSCKARSGCTKVVQIRWAKSIWIVHIGSVYSSLSGLPFHSGCLATFLTRWFFRDDILHFKVESCLVEFHCGLLAGQWLLPAHFVRFFHLQAVKIQCATVFFFFDPLFAHIYRFLLCLLHDP